MRNIDDNTQHPWAILVLPIYTLLVYVYASIYLYCHETTYGRTIINHPKIVSPVIENPCEGWVGDRPSTLTDRASLYMSDPLSDWTFGQTQLLVSQWLLLFIAL
jgi:hypothetical protein